MRITTYARRSALALMLATGCASSGDRGGVGDASASASASPSAVRRSLRAMRFDVARPAPTLLADAAMVAARPSARSWSWPAPIAPMRDHSGRYLMRRHDSTSFFTSHGFAFNVASGSKEQRRMWGLQANLLGAREVAPSAELPRSTYVNDYFGPDSEGWSARVPTYGRLSWEEVYPGIDLVAEPSAGGFSYRFIVSPGADPARIGLQWAGAKELRITEQGRGVDVVVGGGVLRMSGLRAFALDGEAKRELAVRHVVEGDRIGFAVDGWDGTQPLVIDPTVAWASYLGGSAGETSDKGAGVDSAGNLYVSGVTTSSDYPTTTGAYDVSFGAGPTDLVISKITTAGALEWSTYFGGPNNDQLGGARVDSAGNVYVGGYNAAGGLPMTGGFKSSNAGSFDAFIAKFTSTGSLSWSSYLGGTDDDRAYNIALDGAGSVYLTGHTLSTDFPMSAAYDSSHNGGADIFVAKISATGGTSGLLWTTYLGGPGNDYANAIAADATAVYVGGNTDASGFPLSGAFDTTFAGASEGVVFKMAAGGGASSLAWSSYLGGAAHETAYSIAVDGAGQLYVAGFTGSGDFPTTSGFDTTFGGTAEGFVTPIKSTGVLVWSTFVGGSGYDSMDDVQLFGGSLYVLGHTGSPDFPLLNAFDSTLVSSETSLTKVKLGATPSIEWSSFVGGGAFDEYGGQLAIDPVGNLYVASYTTSGDAFTKGAFDTTLGGSQDLYVSKIFQLAQGDACGGPTACPSGFCVDGVCCSTACTAPCQACSAAKKGSGASGTCGNIAADTDPDNDCTASAGYPADCKADGMCDGAGACRVAAKAGTSCSAATCSTSGVATGACNGSGTCAITTAPCGPYACVGTACKSTCTTDSDCASSSYCATGACTGKKLEGLLCMGSNECAAGTCVNCGSGSTCRTTACPDAGVTDTGADTAVADTAVADTFVTDTFVADTFVPDTFVADTFVADTFVPDTFVADTFVADTSKTDTAVADTFVADTAADDTSAPEDTGSIADTATAPTDTGSTDAAAPEGGTLPAEACGCRTPGGARTPSASLALLGLAWLLARRRRATACRPRA